MNYLVTGGAGFIGSNLVDKLLELGHRVIVLDDFSGGKEQNLASQKNNPNLKIVKKSIGDNLQEILSGEHFDGVFHFAARPRVQYSIEHPVETHDINVNGTLNLLEFCRVAGIKRIVFSSSSSVYGDQKILPLVETMTPDPLSPYALHKLLGEEYMRLYFHVYGLETISLRYFNVYGPRIDPSGGYPLAIAKFINLVKKGESPTITGDGEQTRDFTYVGDAVRANILAMETTNKECFGQSFNIGAGNNVTINHVASEIIKLSGKDIKPVYIPARFEPRNTLADHTKAKNLLGWEPEVVFEEGLKRTWDYFVVKSPHD